MSNIITSAMRHRAAVRTPDHFGFIGRRAAIGRLYERPEGASQDEVNEAAAQLGSPQKGGTSICCAKHKDGDIVWSPGTIRDAEESINWCTNSPTRLLAPLPRRRTWRK